jgi:hypothetical protein
LEQLTIKDGLEAVRCHSSPDPVIATWMRMTAAHLHVMKIKMEQPVDHTRNSGSMQTAE